MRKPSFLTIVCVGLGLLTLTVSCGQAGAALCSTQTKTYLDEIEPLIDEFFDAALLADSTPRTALPPVIGDMQRIAREIEDHPAPDCAAPARESLIGGMGLLIDGYMGFMSQGGIGGIREAHDQINTALEELTDLALGDTPPTATPTNPPLATGPNPVPRGQAALTPDGWQVLVLDFNPDAWPVVQAENKYNEPPAPGNRMVVVRVAVTNTAAPYDPAVISEARFYLLGSANAPYSTYGGDSSCGVIPDELLHLVDRGRTTEGNVCFQIPDSETDLRLLYEYDWHEYSCFAVE